MTIKTYYVSKSGNEKLSTNFRVKEFQCHDGSDKVLIDTALVSLLQRIRNHFGKSVTVTSGYRTPTYNASIGGATNSYHTKGQAADIQVSGVHPAIVATYVETLKAGGIGLYAYVSGGFVHVDTRSTAYRWLQLDKNSTYRTISKHLPTIKQGISNNVSAVKLLQRQLGVYQTGVYNETTTSVVKSFQAAHGLTVDGIVGKNTWTVMFS